MQHPITTRAFLEWARKKPADEKYSYDDPTNCAIAQYLKSCGFTKVYVGGSDYNCDGRGYAPLPPGWSDAAINNPYTFGALADRLEALVT
jgi:hypothetical protein